MSEREHVSPPGRSTMTQMAGVSLVAAACLFFTIASGVWPGGTAGEGGLMAAPSSPLEAAMRAVRDAIVAALIALGGLGTGASGIILIVSGEAGLSARICLKAATLALLLALLAAPILQIAGGPAMGPAMGPAWSASEPESATVLSAGSYPAGSYPAQTHPAKTYPGGSE